MESDNEWLDSPQQVYSVTISKFLTVVNFPLEIKKSKTRSLFDMGTQVSYLYPMIATNNLHQKLE